MKKDKISIIIPVYNVEQYLEKCINSVINQSYDNLEIIIINDGSTDNSGLICKYYLAKDNRITYIEQTNLGLSVTRNKGIEISSGNYIAFIDSDDFIEYDMYETLYNNLFLHSADISICNTRYVSAKGDPILNKYGKEPFRNYPINTNNDILLNDYDKMLYFVKSNNNFAWNKLYKKSLFNKIYFPKGKYYEDIFTIYKVIEKAERIYILSEYKYNYVQRPDSIINKPFELSHLDALEAYIEQYNNVLKKHHTLEIFLRKNIFTCLLNCMYKAYTSDKIYMYYNELLSMINIVKKYSIYDCEISEGQKNMLKILLEDNDIARYKKIIQFYLKFQQEF